MKNLTRVIEKLKIAHLGYLFDEECTLEAHTVTASEINGKWQVSKLPSTVQ